MAHLHKKIKKGRPYYYVREMKRIGGKPTVVNQVYLGTADRILSVFMDRKQAVPRRISSKEFGSVFALWEIEKQLDLAGIIDEVVGVGRKTQGPTVGQMTLLAVINRAISPRSKRGLSSWYEGTDIQSVFPVKLKALSPQNFWNHWERISEQKLHEISARFFQRVKELFGGDDEHYLLDTTNYYTYMDSTTPSELSQRGHNKAGKHHLRQVGVALITERSTALPVYYSTYAGNIHDAHFFWVHLEEILQRLSSFGSRELTLVFDKGMNAKETISRIDTEPHVHFITSYSPYFAPELSRVPLRKFEVLACRTNDRISKEGHAEDQILYYQATAPFWDAPRNVIVTFSPLTYRKKRYDLRQKLQVLREELFELRRKHNQGAPHWRDPEAVLSYYHRRARELHLSPELFQLSFFSERGRPSMAFELNRYKVESLLRRYAKVILVTDHQNWSPTEIYEAYMDRYLLEEQFRRSKCPFRVAFMPQSRLGRHWTDSKVRIHVFVCVAALTYLTILERKLNQAGLEISLSQAMEQLRSLRTAIFWVEKERKPRRLLETPTPLQLSILDALGFQVKEGRVLQK